MSHKKTIRRWVTFVSFTLIKKDNLKKKKITLRLLLSIKYEAMVGPELVILVRDGRSRDAKRSRVKKYSRHF